MLRNYQISLCFEYQVSLCFVIFLLFVLFTLADEMISPDDKQDKSMPEKEQDMSSVLTSDSLELYTKSYNDLENANSIAALEDKEFVDEHMSAHGIPINDVQKDYQERPLSSSIKSDDIPVSTLKRDSPVGDDDAGTFSEYNFDRKYSDEHLEERLSSQEQKILHDTSIKSSSKVLDQPGLGVDFVEDVVRSSSALYLEVNSNTGAQFETQTGLSNSRPPSLGADSAYGFRQNSLKHSRSMDSIYG